MITKVQGKTVSGELSVKACPRLNGLEKAMLKWAVVDPEDRVLDASVGRGLMAEYLRRNMQCEVCGVSSDMEEVRSARARLQSCDIVYAPVGDIPWREGAFDTVLMQWKGDADSLDRMLGEVLRVLKPGGALLSGFNLDILYAFDESETTLINTLPFNPLVNEAHARQLRENDDGMQFSHSLEELINGQLEAGFMLTNLYDDTSGAGNLHEHNIATFVATRAEKAGCT